MAKTYEELKEMGWTCPSGNMSIWHHGAKMQIRTSYEADAEFRERLEQATPGYQLPELSFDELMVALDTAKEIRSSLYEQTQRNTQTIERLEEKAHHAGLWQVNEGQTYMPPMTWDELWAWLKTAKMKGRVTSFGRIEIRDTHHGPEYGWGNARLIITEEK